jgi:hypothetical protein
MNQKAAYSFTVDETPAGKRITYQKTKPGLIVRGMKFWGMIVLSVIITSLLNFILHFQTMTSMIFLFIVVLAGVIYLFRKKGVKLGQSSSFEITDKSILIGDSSYSRDHITSLFIKDPQGNAVNVANVGPTLVVGGRGFAGAAAVGAHVMGQSIMAIGTAVASHEAKKNYKIMFRYGEQDVVLADRLRQNTAEVMFEKIKSLF